MKLRKIAKSDIKELLRRSTAEYDVYAPFKAEGADVLFTVLPKNTEFESALDKLALGSEWTVTSPKDIFFPQLDEMFTFDKNGVKTKLNKSKKLIFGVKPCDAKGILFADDFFKRNFEDAYYLSRIAERLIITIGCLTPPRADACFCTSAKTGPFMEKGFDLQLIDSGNDYLVEIGSTAGENFISAYGDLFKKSQETDVENGYKIKKEAAKAVKIKVDFDKAIELMKGDKVFEENYRRISERCVYCGACLYVCPTCTCFNVFDDKTGDEGVRKRNWDACILEGYTREASGHNPRKDKWLRASRRYEHKLKYDYEVNGMSGCIACGRCLMSCPVKIGMSKFIEEITTDKKTM